MNDPTTLAQVTLSEALRQNSPEEREAFIERACAGNPELRQNVQALLHAHREDAEDLVETQARPPESETEASPFQAESAGQQIGRYKLLQKLGEGGFGVVWMAEQEKPVRRRVALKIIKLGMDTKDIMARFEQERQALAMMDHPNIAKVFDAGATPTRRPYFVMELVRGVRITDYCDQANLAMKDRLQIFIAVCHAVQHAHQKGIIHRDLKPSNVLVTLHDGVPVPKVIDFGVAKATQQRLTDLTVFTRFEQMIGTPLYMSPEQAEMSGLDIDTRSDIYSLGVLLYELLTGRTPFDPKELLKRGLDDIRRIIRDREPQRPSTALRTMAPDTRTSVALHRQADAARLPGLLRGDLDWIVMKSLEKDRTRRYESANAFADDVSRYLRNEPVAASPPGNVYRFRKLVRRNRLAFAAGGAVLVVLVAGLAVSLWMFFQEQTARRRAVAAEQLQERLRDEAVAARANEAAQRARTEAMLTRMELQRAEDFADKHDTSGELAYLARVLRRDPRDLATANRLLSTLRDRSHLLPARPPLVHDLAVEAITFSPDGKRLATATMQGARIWDVETGRMLGEPAAITDNRYNNQVSFNRDGTRFVLSGVDARVFDSATGQPVTPLLVHQGRSRVGERVKGGSYFSPDGRLLATLSTDAKVIVWDVASGQPAMPPLVHGADNKEYIWACAFSLDGRFILTGATDGKLRMWDAKTGGKLAEENVDGNDVAVISVLKDGRHVCAATSLGIIRVWDLETRKFLEWNIDCHARLRDLAVTTDGSAILTATADGTVRAWEAATGRSLGTAMEHGGDLTSMILNSEHGRLITTTSEPRVWVWGLQMEDFPITSRRLASSISASALAPDGSLLALGGTDGTVTFWRVAVNAAQPLSFDPGSIQARSALDPAGNLVVTGEENGLVKIWDAHTGRRVGASIEYGATPWLVAFSPDSQRLITGGKDSSARLWNLADRRGPIWNFHSGGYVNGGVFSRDGKRLLVNGAAQSARVWNLETGEPLTGDLGKFTQFGALNFDASRAAIKAEENVVKVWKVPGGEPCEGEARHKGSIADFHASPDGRLLATASADGTARVWKFDPVEAVSPPLVHKNRVTAIRFSPDGEEVVTASADHTAQVWRWKTGEAVGDPLRHNGGLDDAAFSPDGKRIATVSDDRTIRIWEATTGRPLSAPLEVPGVSYRLEWAPDGERLFAVDTIAPAIWDVAQAATPAPDWLADWAEAVGGERLDLTGHLVPVGFEEYQRWRTTISQQAGDDLYSRLARWFFAGGPQRPISPNSKVTLNEFLGQAVRTASPYTLRRLSHIAPEDLRARARLVILLGNSPETLPPDWLAQSAAIIEQGKAAMPREASFWLADSLLGEKQGRAAAALTAAQRAAELAPDDYEPWSQVADLLGKEGRNAECYDALTRAIAAASIDPGVRRALGEERIAVLVKLGRLAEASAEARAVRGLPERSKDATPSQVDLSLYYNSAFDRRVGSDAELAAVPVGLQTMAGTTFDVRGVVQLRGVSTAVRTTDSFPAEVTGIAVAQTCRQLHFLHASRNTYDGSPRAIARYIVHYEDGSSEEAPVMLQRDTADRYRFDTKTPPPPLVVAWSMQKDFYGKLRGIFLFKMTWQNPHPEKVIQSLDFVSAKTDAAPFLVAITTE